MNRYLGCNYDVEWVLSAIKECILPLMETYKWGYSIPYAISGIEEIHPYYARDELGENLVYIYNKLKNIGNDRPMKYEKRDN